MVEDIYFIVKTPQGISIRTTKKYWKSVIIPKHPSIERFEDQVEKTLQDPDQLRRSKQDKRVHLYYRSIGKLWICIVVDHINTEEGYIITAYITDRIKEGEQIYEKNKN